MEILEELWDKLRGKTASELKYIQFSSAQIIMEGPFYIWQQRKTKYTDNFNMNYFSLYESEYKQLNLFFLPNTTTENCLMACYRA